MSKFKHLWKLLKNDDNDHLDEFVRSFQNDKFKVVFGMNSSTF